MNEFRLREESYRIGTLSSTHEILTHNCCFTRGNKLCNSCPTHGCCKDQFGLPSVAQDTFLKFRCDLYEDLFYYFYNQCFIIMCFYILQRSGLWCGGIHDQNWSTKNRKAELERLLTEGIFSVTEY